MKNSFLFLSFFLIPFAVANSSGIEKNTAQMQAMDKITGRVCVIDVPVNGKVEFGSLSIVVRSCKARPAEETPDNFAFVDISDKTLEGNEINIFKGWMISSSPATHAVEHPIYDVWLLQCLNTEVDNSLLLNDEQLAARDALPMQKNISSSTQLQTGELTMNEPMHEMNEQEHSTNIQESSSEFSYDEEDVLLTPEEQAADEVVSSEENGTELLLLQHR